MIPSCTRSWPRVSFRLALYFLLALFALTAAAQSGRRSVSGSPSVTPPKPEADTAPGVKKPEPKDAKRQDIIVSADSGNVFGDIPPYFYDTVLMSCAGRLDDARGVRVDVVSKRTNRSDAINNAKSQKEAYVVWLQLRTDGVDSSIPNGDLSTIRVEYIVYEPTTAKVKTQGTCYQGSYRTGGVILAPRTTGNNNPTIAESRLRDSAREAAERILKALSIASPSDIPQH
jgi:hypothetical protein